MITVFVRLSVFVFVFEGGGGAERVVKGLTPEMFLDSMRSLSNTMRSKPKKQHLPWPQHQLLLPVPALFEFLPCHPLLPLVIAIITIIRTPTFKFLP